MITIYTLFQSFWIVMGFMMIARYAWMVIYEMLEKDAGEKYLNGTLEKKWHDYLLKK